MCYYLTMFEKFKKPNTAEVSRSASGKGKEFVRKYFGAIAISAAALAAPIEAQTMQNNSPERNVIREFLVDNFEFKKTSETSRLNGKKLHLYIVRDTTTGKTVEIFTDSDETATMHGPEFLSPLPEYIQKIVDMENSLRRSGLTEPTGNPNGQLRIVERIFEGYGIRVKNTVEVDENGEVVRLIKSEDLNEKPGGSGDGPEEVRN